MAINLTSGGIPPYGMPQPNEIGQRPERQPMGFGFGPGPGPGGPGPGPGGPGPGSGGPGGPGNDPTDDPKFPRSFQMVPTYVVEHGKVTSYPRKHQLEGAIGDTEAKGIRFTTDEKFINGIVVKGDSKYTISDSYFKLDGQGVNDFEGIGAAVMVTDDAELTVKDSYIETNGVIRPCTACGGRATLRVEGCKVYGNSGPLPDYYDRENPIKGPGMMEPPAGLFLGGTIRTHLSVGTTKTFYKDTHIESDSWAALSTDNGRDLYLQADNCDVIVRNVGYGVYADGGCNVVLNDCRFRTATHCGILAGDFTAKFRGCDLKSGKYNFMAHDLSGGADSAAPLEVRDSRCEAEEACLYIKSHNLHVDIEKSQLVSPKYAVHAIVNDDPDARVMPEDCVPYGNKLYITGSSVEGDVVNDDVRDMAIVLKDSTVKGAIQNAYVELDGSQWFAPRDSRVALVNCTSVSGIDAPEGVTVSAVAAAGTTVQGAFDLPSGGKLIIA